VLRDARHAELVTIRALARANEHRFLAGTTTTKIQTE
jgi:hypothetical protein